jgi:hypothetical protein
MQTDGSEGRVSGWMSGEKLTTPYVERLERELQNFTQGLGAGSCERSNESTNAIKDGRITF